MNRLHRALGLFIISVFFFQCQKDLSFIGTPDPGIPEVIAPAPIKATLQGNIVDENGQPAAGVSITVGTAIAITNNSGYFRLNEASLDKNTSLVTAEKNGYFKSYRVFSATSGTNQVFIKLIKKTLAGTISAASGGSVALANGAKITLPANGVVVAATNSPYSGDIKVYAAYIDPTASDIAETVPGSFTANKKDGKRVTLSSFGMLAVELESDAGEKIQIKSDAVASLTTPIPAAVLATAPATISMWSVDDKTGMWKEEGTAIKQGNSYVGDVKHFSFWNCDAPMNAVTLSLTLLNSGKLPLTYATVKVTETTLDSGSYYTYGYTDSLGEVKGYVPANENLLVEVLDPCGNVVYSQTIGPLTKDTDLGVITVSISTNTLLTYKGILLDCNNAPVTNGFAIITFDNVVRYAATDAAGKFETVFIACPASGVSSEVLGVDITAQQQSTSLTVPITAPVTNTGTIITCGTSSVQYITFTLDDTVHNITSAPSDSLIATTYPIGNSETETYIYGLHNNFFNDFINFNVHNVTGPGTFPIASLYVNLYRPTVIQPFNVTFTSFANSAGEFYEGSFSGQFTTDPGAVVHNIEATFRVRRNF